MSVRKIYWAILLALLLSGNSQARLLLLSSQESPLYRSFLESFEESLSDKSLAQGLVYVVVDDYKSNHNSDIDSTIIAAGVKAAKQVATLELGDANVIYTMLPLSNYQWLQDNHMLAVNHQVIFVDQPPYRFVNLAKVAMPSLNSLSCLYGKVSAIHLPKLAIAAKKNQLEFDGIALQPRQYLLSSLDTLVKESELVLVLPDPFLFNRRTVQALLLASLRQQRPILAYSESYVKAGALLALFSTPKQIGTHTAELVNCMVDTCPGKSGTRHYPKYFSVELNSVVARQMGITLLSVEDIQSQLESLELEYQ